MVRHRCIPNYQDAIFSYYRYEPSIAANAIFIILFALSTLLHGFQMWKTRTWYLFALILGGICETIGYIGRLLSALEDTGCWTLGPYLMQSLLILIAPALIAASIYMILGRIILLVDGEAHAIIKRRWLTKIFVTGDVLSLLLQATGGGMMAIARFTKTGEKVVVLGLFVQLFFFTCFITVASILHYRISRNPTPQANDPDIRWRHYLVTLYLTGTLILVRSVFRVVEFIDGTKGPLMMKELYVFVFDGLLIIILMLWMNWLHPGEIGLLLRGERSAKNGLELIKVSGQESRRRTGTMQSLH